MMDPMRHNIRRNFDLSVLIAIKDIDVFETSLKRSSLHLETNGIEIILLVENGQNERILSVVKAYPFVNWKIVAQKDRNTTFCIFREWNQCATFATKSYLLFLTHNFVLRKDIIFKTRYTIENYSNSFVSFEYETCENRLDCETEGIQRYGLLVAKQHFWLVGGFSAIFYGQRGGMENIISKLEYKGLIKININNAFGSEHEKVGKLANNILLLEKYLSLSLIKRCMYPTIDDYKNDVSKDQCEKIYGYEANKYAQDLCEKYLRTFEKFHISDRCCFGESFRVVALIQTYNEGKYISDLLPHLKNYCDGVILLDDSSSDGTYDMAQASNILLKVKKRRVEFNDLENRNILLNLASFVRSEWFFFLDADERFDERYSDIFGLIEKANSLRVDTIGFWVANLWNKENLYRVENRGFDGQPSQVIGNGLWKRLRMFRNIGRAQIVQSNYNLHFTCLPYIGKTLIAEILLLHWGLLTITDREKKYNFYKVEDPHWKKRLASDYEYLLDGDCQLLPVQDIKLPPAYQTKN